MLVKISILLVACQMMRRWEARQLRLFDIPATPSPARGGTKLFHCSNQGLPEVHYISKMILIIYLSELGVSDVI